MARGKFTTANSSSEIATVSEGELSLKLLFEAGVTATVKVQTEFDADNWIDVTQGNSVKEFTISTADIVGSGNPNDRYRLFCSAFSVTGAGNSGNGVRYILE